MPNSTIEKEVCEKCGVEARENTQFCYNCGTPRIDSQNVSDAAGSEHDTPRGTEVENSAAESSNGSASDVGAKAALDELADKLKADEPAEDEKLAQAAEQRRKARVVRRQTKQYTWEPAEDLSAVRVMIFSVLIAIVTAIVVLITIFWK